MRYRSKYCNVAFLTTTTRWVIGIVYHSSEKESCKTIERVDKYQLPYHCGKVDVGLPEGRENATRIFVRMLVLLYLLNYILFKVDPVTQSRELAFLHFDFSWWPSSRLVDTFNDTGKSAKLRLLARSTSTRTRVALVIGTTFDKQFQQMVCSRWPRDGN